MSSFVTVEQQIEALYVGYFGRPGDPVGQQYWNDQIITGNTTYTQAAASFSVQVEAKALYSWLSTDSTSPAAVDQFITQIYQDLFNRNPDAAGLTFWHNSLLASVGNPQAVGQFILNIISGAPAGSNDDLTVHNKVDVAAFITDEVTLHGLTWNQSLESFARIIIDNTTSASNGTGSVNFQDNLWAAFEAQFFPTPLFPLTVDEDHVVGTQDGGNLFNGPLSFGENTFTSGDDIFAFGDHNVLKATFNGSANVFSVEVWDVQKWIIDQTNGGEGKFAWDFNTIDIESESAGFGGHIIQGLKTVDFHDDSTAGTLLIGNNPEPVQELGGTADGFTIIVHQAIGTGHNGVDVDIDASAFNNPRGDTIFVIADVVGGFPTHNGSYVVPDPIKVARHDGDDYDPNWQGYLGDAFAIASGASAGPDGPPPGAVGFTIWDVTSVGAAHARSLNIIALGGEGSTSAHIINLADDGSNTMLFATSKSDSLSTDWENVSHIDLSETSGFVTLTGLETDMDGVHGHRSRHGLDPFNAPTADDFFNAFQSNGGGGLLTSNLAVALSIVGGAGNSFYDLSSLTPAQAAAGSFEGGHSTAGNNEAAFNNAVFLANVPINIHNIQILDDVSAIIPIIVPGFPPLVDNGEAQGGFIDLFNWTHGDTVHWAPLNTDYALIAEDAQLAFGAAPFGLPWTHVQSIVKAPINLLDTQGHIVKTQADLLPSTVTAAHALDLQNGVVPAGEFLLQLLNAEGSTQTVLGADLTITNAPQPAFALNMQDTADGFLAGDRKQFDLNYGAQNGDPNNASFEHTFDTTSDWHGFNVSIAGIFPPNNVQLISTLDWFVSDDGITLENNKKYVESGVNTTTGLMESRDVFPTAFYAPRVVIDNYTTVNIVLPFESVEDIRFEHKGGTSGPTTGDSSEANSVQNYVILGASLIAGQSDASFIDAPVQSVTNASVNFFDNHADNGGSPPGGPDNLVLGDTNFTDLLLPTTELPFDFGDTGNFPAAIGVTSVKIDGTTAGDGVGANLPNKASTTINMFGAGSLEIGATNATNLNAQSSAHLIMDLPGVPDYVPFQGHGAWGIIVNGSLLGQNLLQGTSGKVEIELSANVGDETHGLTSGLGHNIAGHDLTFGLNDFGVYQAQLQSVGTGNPAGWGNDILTGGDGWGAVHAFNLGGSTFFSFEVGVANDGLIVENNGALERVLPDGADGPGNTGDNFFPEGGNDIVNISATEVGKLTNFEQICDSSGSVIFGESAPYDNQSTVWVGFYDVCNSAGPWAAVNALCDPNSGVGGVLNQAITDLWENNPTGEKFVDGYGGSPTGTTATLVTINGFHVGSGGDTIVFGAADWATGNIDDGDISFVRGLVEADGHTQISPNALGFAEFAPVTLGVDIDKNGSVILFDGGNSYSATSQVVSALLNTGIQLFDGGVDAHTTVDILIAYKTTGALGPGINIADLTLANFSGSSETDTTHFQGSGGVLQVHDLVHITTDGLLGLGTLDPHNIDFLV